ncbi:MAG TPA: response regulator [Blastocatellia bacterium]|jgi:CheY-like chemotaxis protein|nr:response regulator [Blastocatellia bacterium]
MGIRILIADKDDMTAGLADDDQMAAPASAAPTRRGGAEILIADENPATLEFFSRLLEDRGFTTLTADSGESVLQSLRQHIVRVVLLGDLMKPPIDGLDLIRRLRPYHIPIVVATSYGADYTLLAKMAGAEVIIHKFADPTYLITTIEQALQHRPLLPLLPPE